MSAVDSDQFSLRWNNFHSNMTTEFHALLQDEDLVDVTLAVDGRFTQAHKIVLSVCSPYFKELFKINPCKHPIVILKDVGHRELSGILQFMYRGEVNVSQEDLPSFLKTAELLQIKGLTGDDSGKAPVETPVARMVPKDVINNSNKTRLNSSIDDYHHSPQSNKRFKSVDTSVFSSNKLISKHQPREVENCKVLKSHFMNVKDEPFDDCNVEVEVEPEHEGLNENGTTGLESLISANKSENSHNSSSQEDFSQATAARLFANISTLPLSQDYGGSQDTSQDGRTVFGCKECEKTFTRRESLKTHVLNIHGKLRGPFVCALCGKLAKNKHSLSTHMYEYHRNFQSTNNRNKTNS